ncbi:MAG: ribosome recycling factor [Lachnospiraceae bacterium]|nr:ribosome recycling factor [Lachnospiraceae bacterium]MBR2996167.1 ribosome recycling factor [Lachnospiraceae bacterium]
MNERIKPYEEKMNKTIEILEQDLQGIRAGRANPHVLDKIRVDYYGTPTPIQGVGNISIPEARIIQITPWDKKLLRDIERAINMSDIGINPTNDGQVIRLVFPELTEERRKELAKEVKKMGEEAKVSMRNIRRAGTDEVKKLKKASEISEDVAADLEDELQKLIDKKGKEVDQLIEAKQKEIMTV